MTTQGNDRLRTSKSVASMEDVDTSPQLTYLMDPPSIEKAVNEIRKLPTHPDSTAGWWCTHTEEMTQLIPFHAESLSCSEPLWSSFRDSVARQLQLCMHCVIAYQKASQEWEVSSHFSDLEKSTARNLLRSLVRWNIERCVPSLRCGALEKLESDSENLERQAVCRQAFLEVLLCPRASMDRRLYTMLSAVFRRSFPVANFEDMLPLVEEHGEVPGGLLFLCFHPKTVVNAWAQRVFKDCAARFPFTNPTTNYLLVRAFAAIRKRLKVAACPIIIGFLEVPLVVLLQGFNVILPVLSEESYMVLLNGTDGEAVLTLAKALESDDHDVIIQAASCLETLLSKMSFEKLFSASKFSVNGLLQSIFDAIRRNVSKVNKGFDYAITRETRAMLRLFGPLFAKVRGSCSKTVATRLLSFSFESFERIIRECKGFDGCRSVLPETEEGNLHQDVFMTCSNILTWFYVATAPKRPLDDADRLSDFVLTALRAYPETSWSWNLLEVVLIADVANFMRCVLQHEGVMLFVEAVTKNLNNTAGKVEAKDIIRQMIDLPASSENVITFASKLWNDVRIGRHTISSSPGSTAIGHEVRIFLDLHSVIGVCDATRVVTELKPEDICWDQVQRIGSDGQKYIQDSIQFFQSTIAARLKFALSMSSKQLWWDDLPFHATHLLSSANKPLSLDAMEALSRMYNAQSATVGGSKRKMVVQLMKTNSNHLRMLSAGLSLTVRVMCAWGSRLCMGAHARFFLWYHALVDLKAADCFADGSSCWILQLLLSFVLSWKRYERDNAGESFNEVCVRFFNSLRQFWSVFIESNGKVHSNEGTKDLVNQIAFGLLEMHEVRGELPCSTWVHTVCKIGPSMKDVPGFSDAAVCMLKNQANTRTALTLHQCQYIAESLQVQDAGGFLKDWEEDDTRRSKICGDAVASLSARKSGLGLPDKVQRWTKIDDHFKSVSNSSASGHTAQKQSVASTPVCHSSQREGLSSGSSRFFNIDPTEAIAKLARTPGAPAFAPIGAAQTSSTATKKSVAQAQSSVSKIAALRSEHRSATLSTRRGAPPKPRPKAEVDDGTNTPAPKKTKYDIIREQKKLEAEQRRLERERAIEAEKQTLNSRSLIQNKERKRELLRVNEKDERTKLDVSKNVLRTDKIATEEETVVIRRYALPDHFRFCEFRSMDEVYRYLLSETSLAARNYPQFRNGHFRSVDSYVRYWEPLLIEECRASVENSMAQESMLLERSGSKHRLEFTVSDSVESIGFFQVLNISRDTRDVVKPLPGSEAEEYNIFRLRKSDLVLLDIPPIVFDASVPVQSSKAVALVVAVDFARGQVSIKLNTAFRSVDKAPGKGRIVNVCRLMALTTFQRQLDALRDTAKIPDGILWPILSPSEGWDMNRKVVQKLCGVSQTDLVIPGEFVKSLTSENRLNGSQAGAIMSVLRSCVPILQSCSASKSSEGNFGGISLIQGPPGTGKTSTIVALLSALLISGSSRSKMRKAGISIDGHRMIVKLPPIRILVCAPSNTAVDEIMARVVNEGLFLPGGIRACPRVVRVGGGTTMQSLHCLDLRRLAKCDEPCSAFEEMMDTASASKKEHLSSLHKLNGEIGEVDRARRVNQDRLTSVVTETNKFEEVQKLEREIREQTEKLSSLHRQKNELHEFLSKDRNMSKEAESVKRREQDQKMCKVINNASIIFATLSSSGHEVLQRFSARFDVIVVDEAAQCCEPDILIPVSVGRRSSTASSGFGHVVLVGDPRQLPATVLSNSPEVSKRLGRSLFERLAEHSPEDVHLLNVQYRMHPRISAFPSQQFYAGRLVDATNVLSASMTLPFHSDSGRRFGPLTFLDTSSRSSREVRSATGSISNPEEARIVVNAISSLVVTYPNYDFHDHIAILSPYREQVVRLKRALFESKSTRDLKVEVNTIDGIQGREKSIVFLSTVRGVNGQAIGFLRDERRMNVAITRAKHSVVIVGHAKVLSANSDAWANLVSFCREKESIHQVPSNSISMFPECRLTSEPHKAKPNEKKHPRPEAKRSDRAVVGKRTRKAKRAKFLDGTHVPKSGDDLSAQSNQVESSEISIARSAQDVAKAEQCQSETRTDQTITVFKATRSDRNESANDSKESSQVEVVCSPTEEGTRGSSVLSKMKPGDVVGGHLGQESTEANRKLKFNMEAKPSPRIFELGLRSVPMPSWAGADPSMKSNEPPLKSQGEHTSSRVNQLDKPKTPPEVKIRELPVTQGAVDRFTKTHEGVKTGYCRQERRLKFEDCARFQRNAIDISVRGNDFQEENEVIGKEGVVNHTNRNAAAFPEKRERRDIDVKILQNENLMDTDACSSRILPNANRRGRFDSVLSSQRQHGEKNCKDTRQYCQQPRREICKGRSRKRPKNGGKPRPRRPDDSRDIADFRNCGIGATNSVVQREQPEEKRGEAHTSRIGSVSSNPRLGFSLLSAGKQLEQTNEMARRANR